MTETLSPAHFEEIVGTGHAREAERHDAVDGIMPRLVVSPGSTEEVAAVLKRASELDLAVVPRGSGSKIGWGSRPRRLDIVLETGRMNRLVEHSAGDLVAIAGAGMPIGDFGEAVAGSGQMLAVDSPWPQATLGGIVASNFAGPRRHRFGTVRDSLIGITVVLADGTIARAGGKVVKNVAGYDLGKLFTGSFGTLGVIAEVIVRLHALPAESRVVTLEVKSVDTVGEALKALADSPLVPTAVELAWSEGAGALSVWLEGFGPAVEDGVRRASELLERLGGVSTAGHAGLKPSTTSPFEGPGNLRPHPTAQSDIGQGFSPESPTHVEVSPKMSVPWSDGEIFLKIATVPSALPEVLRGIDTLAWTKGIETRVTGQAAATVLWVAMRNNGDTIAETVEALRSVVSRGGGTVVVVAAPEDLKPSLDVWGPTTDAFPLMRRVKEQFDPAGTMSPGRFAGGL